MARPKRQFTDKALKLLIEWDKYLDNYDPYTVGGVSQYGQGALGIEVSGVKKRIKEIIAKCKK